MWMECAMTDWAHSAWHGLRSPIDWVDAFNRSARCSLAVPTGHGMVPLSWKGATMRAHPVAGVLAAAACLLCEASVGQDHSSVLGLFESQSDIGSVIPPGTGSYD